ELPCDSRSRNSPLLFRPSAHLVLFFSQYHIHQCKRTDLNVALGHSCSLHSRVLQRLNALRRFLIRLPKRISKLHASTKCKNPAVDEHRQRHTTKEPLDLWSREPGKNESRENS